MYITKHSNVTDEFTLDSLWDLSSGAFQPQVAMDPTREMLFRSGFDVDHVPA
jgi:hypothetical protein